jgi:hypothetical protein
MEPANETVRGGVRLHLQDGISLKLVSSSSRGLALPAEALVHADSRTISEIRLPLFLPWGRDRWVYE